MKNGLVEPGDIVRYHPIIGGPQSDETYRVKELGRLGHGEVVAWLHGKVGCVSLDALTFVKICSFSGLERLPNCDPLICRRCSKEEPTE